MECVSGDADPAAEARVTDQRRPRPLLTAGALVLLVAACFGTFVALVSYGALCDDGCSGRGGTLTAQLVVAVVGLIATVAMAVCVAQGRYSAAGGLLLAAIGLYTAWGVVLDQATHGSYFWQ
jgi:hypothetical protein